MERAPAIGFRGAFFLLLCGEGLGLRVFIALKYVSKSVCYSDKMLIGCIEKLLTDTKRFRFNYNVKHDILARKTWLSGVLKAAFRLAICRLMSSLMPMPYQQPCRRLTS